MMPVIIIQRQYCQNLALFNSYQDLNRAVRTAGYIGGQEIAFSLLPHTPLAHLNHPFEVYICNILIKPNLLLTHLDHPVEEREFNECKILIDTK